jgi:D-alanine-D-alanine ligase
MKELMQGLLKIRVRPYYIYQCDPITGSSHFRTPVETGLEIIEGLRGHTTGYAVPQFVIDAPGGGGKIPLLPNYLVGREGDDVLLRNFEGEIFRYRDPVGTKELPVGAGASAMNGSHAPSRNGKGSHRALKIGLTYDLRDDYLKDGYTEEQTAEFDREDTIAALDDALRANGHDVVRIGRARSLIERLAAGERWDLVFNIAEGLSAPGREAQIPAILDVYGIPYTFSDPVVTSLTLDKGLTKRVLRDLGLPTAPFAIVETPEQARVVDLPYPLFAKPVAEGTGLGVGPRSRAHNAVELETVCRELLVQFGQPVLVESDLPGREFTVGVVGTGEAARAVGALEVTMRPGAEEGIHSYHNKEHCEELVDYILVDDEDARESCRLGLAAWRGLNCRDGGRVDLRADAEGRLQILEINPLAGLHPSHSDLPILWTQVGREYNDLIGAIVESARTRCGATR